MTFVSELEPTELWTHFDEILKIPRGSKNETAIANYVIGVAKKAGLEFRQDALGSIVVKKPGTPGLEGAPITILQGHLDMVNEKNDDVEHDFDKDPIRPVRKDDYLAADGTTLGSDNGIGVAASLALMASQSVPHGPLEFLFTVDEETGLTGASGLATGMLEGKTLINLDTEEEGALYVGCAGGAGVDLNLTLEVEPAPEAPTFEVKLKGLKGGHSGIDIQLQRGNAIRLLARALRQAEESVAIRLTGFGGGNMHNAIPREASAQLVVSEESRKALHEALESSLLEVQAEFAPAEPGITWEITEIAKAEEVMTEECSRTLLALLDALPHGIMSMSYDIPDLVETSANLATVAANEGVMKIHISNRSSVGSALKALQKRVASIGVLAGAEVKELEGYPGWKPDMASHVLKVSSDVFRRLTGKEPEVKAVHAGLECGIIGEKYPGMDMVSFGPQIEFPHSPDECVKIDTVAEFYKLLVAILEELATDTPSV